MKICFGIKNLMDTRYNWHKIMHLSQVRLTKVSAFSLLQSQSFHITENISRFNRQHLAQNYEWLYLVVYEIFRKFLCVLDEELYRQDCVRPYNDY